MEYLLVDNGSLRATSVLNLRRIAHELGTITGERVYAASLLHSSKVPAEELDGEQALTWERWMKRLLSEGKRDYCVIPFFFGPTAAILEYMPQRILALKESFGEFHIERTPFVFAGIGTGETDLLEILAERVEEVLEREHLKNPKVILVDHGSPQAEVAQLRNYIAGQLDVRLRKRVQCVVPASMESRDGEDYAFNRPLLSTQLAADEWNESEIVISMLFLSPGRHAGEGGDVATICHEAQKTYPSLKTYRAELVGTHPGIVPLLERRMALPRTVF